MEQYIPKSALVAEIESLLDKGKYHEEYDCAYRDGNNGALYALKGKVNSLEVKEVDLEKELIEWHKEHFKKDGTFIGMAGFYLTNSSQMDIAKHFFELGLNASNPLTWEDMMLIHKCCKDAMNSNLYVWQTAEGQQKIYEDVLKRFKVQKGE